MHVVGRWRSDGAEKIHFWLPVLIFSSQSCERSSSKSQLTQKNAIKRDKAELAQSLASVSILSKNAIKRDKAELAQSLASVSILSNNNLA